MRISLQAKSRLAPSPGQEVNTTKSRLCINSADITELCLATMSKRTRDDYPTDRVNYGCTAVSPDHITIRKIS